MSTVLRWLVVLLGLLAIGAAGMLLSRPQVERYVTSKSYCGKCHGEQVAHVGAHATPNCDACHQMPQQQPYSLLLAGLRGAMPKHGSLVATSCTSCHQKDVRKWSALARTAGHAAHTRGPNATACATCHGPSLHEQPAASERCEACHADTVAKREHGPQLDCTRCHVFGSQGDRSRSAPKPGTEVWGSEITGARVHGAADCQLCHNPHQPEAEAELTAKIDCTSCHRAELARSVTHAPENHEACTTCHRPHGLRSELATACTMCHEKPRIHGDKHDPGVPQDKRALTTIASLLAAREGAPQKPPPGVTHGGECATCHTPHDWAPDKDSCMSCHEHEQKAKQIAALPKDSHSCLGCHEPHSPAPGKEACDQCHGEKTRTLKKAIPEKHHDCLACHEPHEGKPKALIACGKTCHDTQADKLRDGQVKHRDCVSCHNPHADPKQGAVLACKNCHADKVAGFAGSKHETCSQCHSEHVFNGKAALAACGSCHTAPLAVGASHHDECTKCHTPHQPGRGPAANCVSCHEQIKPQVSTHQRCNNCHTPHLPKETASTQCGHCHQKQAQVASAWPANSPHNTRCADCHQKHDERDKQPCGSCHAEQNKPEHTGVHKECKGCHAPHLAPPTEPTSWWGRCATCHKSEGAAAATGNAKHQLCANCHDNKGREPKQCLTCHTDIRQQGEHQQAKHDTCTSCHAKHGTTPPVRKACESCHEDRRNHFPDAPRCQSCHPFAKE
jgi:hypothetical protein